MNWLAWAVFAAFLGWVVVDGIRRARGAKGLEDYYAGGRGIPWWAAGLSVMATQASAITVIGTTGQGHDDGMQALADALAKRHVYSTLDRNCHLMFTVNDAVMGVGTALDAKSQVPVRIAVTGRRVGPPLFEPMALPTASSWLPSTDAVRATSISGAEVPTETTVRPMSIFDTPTWFAALAAPDRNLSALHTRVMKPNMSARTKNHMARIWSNCQLSGSSTAL